MEETKDFTSDVEDKRLASEEFINHSGQPIFPEQIWRDGLSIPTLAPTLSDYQTVETSEGSYEYAEYAIQYATKSVSIMKHFKNLPLTRVQGTTTCYYSENLVDIIPYNFDKVNHSYVWHIYLNDLPSELNYGVGGVRVDRASGILSFDEEFVKEIDIDKVSITFYKYTGRKGFFGTTLEEDLPFSDDKSLLFKADNPAIESSIKSRGAEGVNGYILPPVQPQMYTKDTTDSACGVLLLQENLNSTLDNICVLDGGIFL